MGVMNNKMAIYNWRNDLWYDIAIQLSSYESQMCSNCYLNSLKMSGFDFAVNVY